MPFLGENTFCYEKQKAKQKTTKKENQEGLGPSEVALWATWPLNPPQKKNQNKKKEKTNK